MRDVLIFLAGLAVGGAAVSLWMWNNSRTPFGGIIQYAEYRLARRFGKKSGAADMAFYSWRGKMYPDIG